MSDGSKKYVLALTSDAVKEGKTSLDILLRLGGLEGVVIDSPTGERVNTMTPRSCIQFTYSGLPHQIQALLGDQGPYVTIEEEIPHNFVD